MAVPPLVEPGPPLTPAETLRYARHLTLPGIGVDGQRRLRAARVLVLGAGGLGSPVLLYLAAAGVGTIGVVDDDVVELSNLQRQVIHAAADVGRLKVESAADAVSALDPAVAVVPHPVRLTAAVAPDLLAQYDLVLDGADNFPTRFLASDACELAGIPHVWGSILRFDGQVSTFWARHGPTLRDLFPRPPAPGSIPSCAQGGVLGALCGTVGSLMATEAIRLITGAGRPLIGRVLVYDALASRLAEIPLRRDPTRPAVTRLSDESPADVVASDGDTGPPVATLTPGELAAALAAARAPGRGGTGPLLVDVREATERAAVVLPDDVHVPLDELLDRGWGALEAAAGDRLAAADPVVLYCLSGVRSARAVRVLAAAAPVAGRPRVAGLEGGVLAWAAHATEGRERRGEPDRSGPPRHCAP